MIRSHIRFAQRQRTWQDQQGTTAQWLDVWQTDLESPDFAAFVENRGGYGVCIESDEKLDTALEIELEYDRSALVEVLGLRGGVIVILLVMFL